MSFVVIAFCFAVQWFFHLSSVPYQKQWVPHYITWMRKTFSSLMNGHALFSLLVLVLPILIVVSLLFTLVYHVLGHGGYLIVSMVLLWYCIDITALRGASAPSMSAEHFLMHSYQKIFSPLLWYFITGPVGLVFSVVVSVLHAELRDQKYFALAAGVVDWVPVRVLGLTFALVGNFAAVFKLWMKDLVRDISDEQNQVLVLARAALGTEKNLVLSDVISLIHRAVLIWLVLIALLSVSGWIG